MPGEAQTRRRTMRLPYNSMYPDYAETHLEDDWCAKAGCRPVCRPAAVEESTKKEAGNAEDTR